MAKARDSIKETLDRNRKGYRNGRKEPEVVVISSSEASEEDEDELAYILCIKFFLALGVLR